METIEKIGKTVDEAVEAALAELNATKDEVEIVVIEEETKGFLGLFGNKPAKVKVTMKFDPVKAAKNFLRETCLAMGLSIETEIELKDAKHMFVELKGDSTELRLLIGKRGQTKTSLYRALSITQHKTSCYQKLKTWLICAINTQ